MSLSIISDEDISDDDGNVCILPEYSTLDGQVKSSLFRKKPQNVKVKNASKGSGEATTSHILNSDANGSDDAGKINTMNNNMVILYGHMQSLHFTKIETRNCIL